MTVYRIGMVPLQTIVTVCQRVIVLGKIVDRTPDAAVYELEVMGMTFQHQTLKRYTRNTPSPSYRRVLRSVGWEAWIEHEIGVSTSESWGFDRDGKYCRIYKGPNEEDILWGKGQYPYLDHHFTGDLEVFSKAMLYASMIGAEDDWSGVATA